MNQKTTDVRQRIANDEAIAQKMIGLSVVPTNEIAEKVNKGLNELRKMSGEDLEKLNSLSAKEIAKGWESSDVKVMAKTLEDSLGLVSDVLVGNQLRNPVWNAAQKSLEHLQNPSSMVRTISNMMSGPETTGIDLGWRRAFNFLSVDNEEEVEVIDWTAGLKFLEYEYRTDKPEAQTVGGRKGEKEGPRFFGAAFKHANGAFRHSVVTLNQLLSYMRQEAIRTQSLLAYRTIAAKKVGNSDVVGRSLSYDNTKIFKDWSTVATDRETIEKYLVWQIRHVLNEARRLMIDNASQTPNSKSRKNHAEARLNVTANDTVLFYYNHKERELIDKVQQGLRGENGVDPSVIGNIAFIESSMMPVGGGYDVTAKDNQRDTYGFRESVTETVAANKIGGMMVIPGNRNFFINFRPLTFLNDSDVMSESNTVGAKMEANCLMDKRQKFHIVAGTH